MTIGKKATAEFLGTFWLTFGGCGTAVLAGAQVGWLGVSLAFGLTVVTMAYAIGHVSGCHLNPAVSVGLVAGGRMPAKDLPAYVLAQVAGAVAAAFLLSVIVKGAEAGAWEAVKAGGFASNGYGDRSPGGFGLSAAFVTEAVLTFVFLFVIHGVTSKGAAPAMAGLAIGLALTLIHLVSIPVTNTSVNPARSTGPALLVGGGAVQQLWLFWVAPILGGALGGIAWKAIEGGRAEPT
jgi:aquaporin Z